MKKKKNIILRKIHGATFLINICDNYCGDQCAIYEINETGEFIWNHLDGATSLEEVCLLLKNKIIDDIDYDVIYHDIVDYLHILKELNFLEM